MRAEDIWKVCSGTVAIAAGLIIARSAHCDVGRVVEDDRHGAAGAVEHYSMSDLWMMLVSHSQREADERSINGSDGFKVKIIC